MTLSFTIKIVKLNGEPTNCGSRIYSCREEAFGYLHRCCSRQGTATIYTSIPVGTDNLKINPYIAEIIGTANIEYDVTYDQDAFCRTVCNVTLHGAVNDVLPVWWWTTICQRISAYKGQEGTPGTFEELMHVSRHGWQYAVDRSEAIRAYKRRGELGAYIMEFVCGPAMALLRLSLDETKAKGGMA